MLVDILNLNHLHLVPRSQRLLEQDYLARLLNLRSKIRLRRLDHSVLRTMPTRQVVLLVL